MVGRGVVVDMDAAARALEEEVVFRFEETRARHAFVNLGALLPREYFSEYFNRLPDGLALVRISCRDDLFEYFFGVLAVVESAADELAEETE